MDSLDSLEQNLRVLLERYEALQQENKQLRAKMDGLHQDLVESHAELSEMQKECYRLRTANALAGDDTTRQEAYRRLSQMIAQVDKAIELIKE